MDDNKQEEKFLLAFSDLVAAYSKEFINSNSSDFSKNDSKASIELIDEGKENNLFFKNHSNQYNSELLRNRFESFMNTINETRFEYGLIPYDKLTEIVFKEASEDSQFIFTQDLKQKAIDFFLNDETENSERNQKCFYKIIRHINLALTQKSTIIEKKIAEIKRLQYDNQDLQLQYIQLNDKAEKQFKAIQQDAKKNIENLKKEMKKQYDGMMSQYISILGIFAGILMGAFGAIQGFTSLFNNANKLPLGKILIISSIGASSVILILFFLLNGIAKLTGKSLSSARNNDEKRLMNRHPTIVIGYGILIFISLVGIAWQLIIRKVGLNWSDLWLMLPLTWLIYLLVCVYKNEIFIFPFKHKQKEVEYAKETQKQSV